MAQLRERYPDLEGQVAVVTGANGGIGAAIVASLRAQGAIVIATDQARGYALEGPDRLQLDVTDRAAVAQTADIVLERHGRLDIWINNAGMLVRAPALTLDALAWNRTLDVNLSGVFFGAQSAANIMARAGGGRIVNLSSYAGLRPRPECADYAAAKAGVAHLTACLAREWGPLGIRVNAIAPGYIDTTMSSWMHENPELKDQYVAKTPAGRIGDPSEIASVAAFLCANASSFMTGQVLTVDGGISLT